MKNIYNTILSLLTHFKFQIDLKFILMNIAASLIVLTVFCFVTYVSQDKKQAMETFIISLQSEVYPDYSNLTHVRNCNTMLELYKEFTVDDLLSKREHQLLMKFYDDHIYTIIHNRTQQAERNLPHKEKEFMITYKQNEINRWARRR